jgi:hypothetical protein
MCCTAGQECAFGACVIECADEAQRCGASGELCCPAGDACLGDGCVTPGDSCVFTEDCPIDAICEPTLRRCVPRDAVEVCEYRPPVGNFEPIVRCQWAPAAGDRAASADVVMTPAVANLTDDNGDGVTDRNDVPDVVFISFDLPVDGCCTARGTVRIVSGRCNDDGTMQTLGSILTPFVANSSGVALGNLDPDTITNEHAPEIVATFGTGGTVAWRRTASDGSAWQQMWRSTYPTSIHATGGESGNAAIQPALADLDRDGRPEVIVGNVVLDGLDGSLRWDGKVTVGATAGVGNNAFLGPVSIAADIDLDGFQEVIAGNTVYDGRTGAQEWTYTYTSSNLPCGGRCDGFPGVGNFDEDPEGEVVIVRQGEVFVLHHDGALLRKAVLPNGECTANEGGPPTVADFDGDGRPEIGVAGADFYAVIDFDCDGDPLPSECRSQYVRWAVPNNDCSSRSTGSSVFDFDGDGRAEVVYADETNFRIFDGSTGMILFDDPTHRSNTRLEMPIIVDLDNDGKSEVLVPRAPTLDAGPRGLTVFSDSGNNWVRTRRIWNQHAYSVTNITENGQVPREPEVNWLNPRLNNFRQNVQPSGLFDAPDLQITAIELIECVVTGVLRLAITVTNRGALGVGPGIAVNVQATPDGGSTMDLGVHRTTMTLAPGRSEVIQVTWDLGAAFEFPTFTVRAIADDDGAGAGAYNECHEDDNELVSAPLMTCHLN